jgi:pyruvate,water dikinase
MKGIDASMHACADEKGGFWAFDRVHAPRPLTPLSQDLLLPAFGEGMTDGLRQIGYPHAVAMRAVNEYAYLSVVESEACGTDLHQLFDLHLGALSDVLPNLGTTWSEKWLPSILPGLERLRTLEYVSLSWPELVETLTELRADLVGRWRVHGLILPVYLAASRFEEFYQEEFEPEDPTEPYALLHGFPTRAWESSRDLWRLSRRALQLPAVSEVFARAPASRVEQILQESVAGREFLAQLQNHLHEFGWRSDGIFELADPMWWEEPTRVIGAIQGLLAVQAHMSPDDKLAQATRRRQELLELSRARLAHQPTKLARFDELYAQARWYYPIDEDHNAYIDQMGNAGMRLPVLEIGRRLVATGVLASVEDVFFLHLHELFAAGDLRPAIAERRAALAVAADSTPVEAFGEPPNPQIPDPLLTALSKQDASPLEDAPDVSATVVGIPGSPGVARGRARVARTLAEASVVRPGEVLVCEMTLPPWTPLFSIASAVVADTGGVLSHAAIVARECDIPCVVGTLTGTHQIKDGAFVVVDGTRGTVQVTAG